MARSYKIVLSRCLLILGVFSVLSGTVYAGNQVLGEIHLKGSNKAAKDSGIWVDGQYMGYLKELSWNRKVLLLPGAHEIQARQAGFRDFSTKITVAPGVKQTVRVEMVKDLRVQYPHVTAEIKLDVEPMNAAVFVDGLLLGHVEEFEGTGRGLLVAPGERRISISLPGYRTFDTSVNLAANQKFKLKTNLIWEGVAQNSRP